MKNLFLSLFLIFSLVYAPIVHAAGWCEKDIGQNVHEMKIKKDTSSDQKQEKSEKLTHHCCSHNICDNVTASAETQVVTGLKVITPAKDDAVSSLVFELTPEPPSHA